MSKRNGLLNAAKRGSDIIEEFDLRKRIDEGYTRIDPAYVASLAEVPVLYCRLERLLGGYLNEDGQPGILVNHDRPRGLVHMTCAHELGHFVLGHDSTTDEKVEHGSNAPMVEQEADQFAYSLLAPPWLIVATARAKGWTKTRLREPLVVYQLSLRLGMSYTAAVWSLKRSGYLPDDVAASIRSVQPKALKEQLLQGRPLADSKADVWVLDSADRDKVLEPGPGDQFVVDLPNHAGAGHLWTVDEAHSEGYTLEPFLRDARRQPHQAKAATGPIGGSGATLRYALMAVDAPRKPSGVESAERARQVRRRAIAMEERAPFLTGAPADTIALSAEYEVMDDGYPEHERDRRIALARGIT